MVLYTIYKLSLLKDPSEFFKMNLQSGVVINFFNVFSYKAMQYIEPIKRILNEESPYFLREKEKGNKFLKLLSLNPAGKLKNLLSGDSCIMHLSELNFVKNKDEAKSIISSACSRVFGRFTMGINSLSFVILDSSATEQDSAVDRFIAEDPQAKDAYIIRVNTWKTRVGMGYYDNSEYFPFYCGSLTSPPFIMNGIFKNEAECQKFLDDITDPDIDKDRLIAVPVQFLAEAERDPELFTQEKAGMSLTSTNLFFPYPDKIKDIMIVNQKTPPIITLEADNPYDDIYSHVLEDIKTIPHERKIFIGIDAGFTTDLFGISIGYCDRIKQLSTLEEPVIRIPLIVGLSRKREEQTPISKVVDFILELSKDYDVSKVFLDNFQGIAIRQLIEDNGIETEIISTIKNDAIFIDYRNRVYQKLIQLPYLDLLLKEFGFVKRDEKGKIVLGHTGFSHCDLLDSSARLTWGMINQGKDTLLDFPDIQDDTYADKVYQDFVNFYSQGGSV